MNPLSIIACRAPRDKNSSSKRGNILAVTLLSFGLTGCFKVSSDVQTLRDRVMKTSGGKWEKQIEIGVGAITVNLAKAGLSFVHLDPEARTALRAVRGAEVGVYELRHLRGTFDPTTFLDAADKALLTRGWDRLVGVMDAHEFVAVFVRNDVCSPSDVKFIAAVFDGRELVLASARSNLEPLMELATTHGDLQKKAKSLIQL